VLDALFSQTAHDNFCARDVLLHASVFMKHSFQGPLEIDRMFFPDEVCYRYSAPASLFMRSRHFSTVVRAKQRLTQLVWPEFLWCLINLSRLWRGLEQTAYK
jgi:hypothetical protein